MGDDLLGVCIDAQVSFTPGPPGPPAMFAHLPLPFAVDFQPRRIDH